MTSADRESGAMGASVSVGWPDGRPARGSVRPSRPLKLALLAILCVALPVVLYAQRARLLEAVALFLTVEDDAQRSDAIFLLSGGYESRPFHAASLYKQGFAPMILITREGDTRTTQLGLYPNATDVAVEILKTFGVRESDIVVLSVQGGAHSTGDEGMVFAKYAREHAIRSTIIVTSSHHTRRTRWAVRRALGDQPLTLRFFSAPDPLFNESNWWKTESGLVAYVNEYLKFIYYVVVGVPPVRR